MRDAKSGLVNLRKEQSWFRAQNGSGVISILVTTEKISQIKLRSLITMKCLFRYVLYRRSSNYVNNYIKMSLYREHLKTHVTICLVVIFFFFLC